MKAYAITQTQQVWLGAKVSESRGRLMLDWDAIEALFPANMIDTMFASYCQLVEQLAARDWRQPITLSLPEEQQQKRQRINQTDHQFPNAQPPYLRFFAQANLHPQATALIWGRDGQMDYDTLAHQALRVAGYLRQQWIRPGDRVAITHAQAAEAAKYIIFTSGSTGTPKGVVVSHIAVANTVDAVAELFGISADDRSITLSALDFDLSAYDIFTFLGRGGSLVVVDEAERRDAAAWVHLINHWQVSIISTVPALVEMITVAAHRAAQPTAISDGGGRPRNASVAARVVEPRAADALCGTGGNDGSRHSLNLL